MSVLTNSWISKKFRRGQLIEVVAGTATTPLGYMVIRMVEVGGTWLVVALIKLCVLCCRAVGV